MKAGLDEALRLGFSHAVQVDADGQHDLEDIPRFLDLAHKHPDALILGRPLFDATAPRARVLARRISTFWVGVETGRRIIEDPQCGFRVYPIAATIAAGARGNHMEFDQEIAVRMAWRNTFVVNVPTRVRYMPAEEGGISHFELFYDNLRITWLHTRLSITAAGLALSGLRRSRDR